MNLDLFNNLFKGTKENNSVQDFIKELSDKLEKNNDISNDVLKQENCLYQVVEIGTDSAFLQNTRNNRVSEETDIPKEILDKIGNDTVLQYKNGQYIVEEELTQKFLDSLIGIQEYTDIQQRFSEEYNMDNMDPNIKYIIDAKENDYSILSYGDNHQNTLKVPNALIPFWAKTGDYLYYKNNEFIRDV